MEFNTIFFTDDIINIIFEKLHCYDKITFSHINQYTYINYYKKCKYLLYSHHNKDYQLFKEWMKIYTYTDSTRLLKSGGATPEDLIISPNR